MSQEENLKKLNEIGERLRSVAAEVMEGLRERRIEELVRIEPQLGYDANLVNAWQRASLLKLDKFEKKIEKMKLEWGTGSDRNAHWVDLM